MEGERTATPRARMTQYGRRCNPSRHATTPTTSKVATLTVKAEHAFSKGEQGMFFGELNEATK